MDRGFISGSIEGIVAGFMDDIAHEIPEWSRQGSCCRHCCIIWLYNPATRPGNQLSVTKRLAFCMQIFLLINSLGGNHPKILRFRIGVLLDWRHSGSKVTDRQGESQDLEYNKL